MEGTVASEKPLFATPNEIIDPGNDDPQWLQKPLGGWPVDVGQQWLNRPGLNLNIRTRGTAELRPGK